MTNTTTRQAYKRTYAPAPASVDLSTTTTCTCGQLVSTTDLFSHECPDDVRSLREASRTYVATTAHDSLDVPEWRGGAAGHTTVRQASEKQVAFLRSLGWTGTEALTSREASRKIEELKAGRQAQPVAETPARSNKFAGSCARCGTTVDAGAGSLDGRPGSWTVSHIECPEVVDEPQVVVTETLADVEDGHYAIDSTGANDLVFYRVSHSDKWGASVQMVVGGHPDRFVARRNVAGILARIAADPDAGPRYGREIGSCYKCNRTLTDDLSRSLGIGPVCRNG